MDEITQMRRRAQARWYADGISELVGGFILAVVGIVLCASTLKTDQRFSMIALAVTILGLSLSAQAVGFVKRRINQEGDGGSRRAETTGRGRAISIACVATAAIGLGTYVVKTGDVTFEGILGTIMVAVLAISVATVMALRAYRLELPRFYASAAVVAVCGVVALLLQVNFIAGMGAMWTGLGIVSMLSGATVFAEYLTKSPEPEHDVS